ncbi:hypothetical protein ACT691_18155 [Vibrio metschnikovii]
MSNTVLAQDPQAWLRDSTRQSSAVLEYLQTNNLASDDYCHVISVSHYPLN